MSDAGIQPVPTPTPEPTPAPTPVATPDLAWVDKLDDASRGYIANKGWHKHDLSTAFGKVLESYRGAETKFGVPPERVLKMPATDAPQSEWDAFHSRLGRPANANEYQFDVGDDGDKAFAERLKAAAFKEGVPKDKAEAIWKEIVAAGTEAEAAEADAAKAALTTETQDLEKQWGKGAEYQAKKLVAMRAAKAAGVTEEQFEESSSKPGFSKAWNLFLFFGQKMGEDKFIPGGIQPGSLYTREQAGEQLKFYKDVRTDKGKRMARNDPEAWAEYRNLVKIAYPEEERRAA